MHAKASIGLILLLASCADTHKLMRADASTARLSASEPVRIAVPADGQYEATKYAGSGRMTTDALRDAFKRRASRVSTDAAVTTREEALASARSGSGYLVVPTILHWEDRATEWSGRADRVEVRVEVFEARTGTRLDSVDVEGTSGWATFGGDHPQDLLAAPFEELVDSLYR